MKLLEIYIYYSKNICWIPNAVDIISCSLYGRKVKLKQKTSINWIPSSKKTRSITPQPQRINSPNIWFCPDSWTDRNILWNRNLIFRFDLMFKKNQDNLSIACESQPHKSHLTSTLNTKTVPVLPSVIFPFHLLPSPMHPARFSFCLFPSFLSIFILLSSNNNNNNVCRILYQTDDIKIRIRFTYLSYSLQLYFNQQVTSYLPRQTGNKCWIFLRQICFGYPENVSLYRVCWTIEWYIFIYTGFLIWNYHWRHILIILTDE